MEKKTLAVRCASLLGAAFFSIFGSNIGQRRFCLGDRIFDLLGIPAWSRGTQGLHYPAIIALIGTPFFFWLFASTTRDRKKTMGNLLVGTVALMWVLSLLQRM